MTEPLVILRPDDLRAIVADAVAEGIAKAAPPPPEWGSIQEAAAHYGVTPQTVRRWIAEGQVEAQGAGKARRVRLR